MGVVVLSRPFLLLCAVSSILAFNLTNLATEVKTNTVVSPDARQKSYRVVIVRALATSSEITAEIIDLLSQSSSRQNT